jgi:hypothetical protein
VLQSLLLSSLMLNTYAYLDEASGQTRRVGKTSRTAIVVVSQDPLGRLFILYTWAGRVKPTEIVDQVIEAHVRYHPKMFGIESNAQQNLFAQLLTELVHRKGIRDFAPVYVRPPMDKTKIERIKNAIQPYGKSGRLLYHPVMHSELAQEIATFPTGQTNDLIDALAGCIALIPPVFEPQQAHTTQDAIKTYLKAIGISENEIMTIPSMLTPMHPQEDPLLKITRERFTRQ